MTGPGKRLCAAVLLLCVLTGGVLPVKADTQEYRQQLLKAYSSSPEGSSATIETCLEALEAESPAQGAMWRQIMFDWIIQASLPAAVCRKDLHRTILCVLWCLATDLTGTAP